MSWPPDSSARSNPIDALSRDVPDRAAETRATPYALNSHFVEVTRAANAQANSLSLLSPALRVPSARNATLSLLADSSRDRAAANHRLARATRRATNYAIALSRPQRAGHDFFLPRDDPEHSRARRPLHTIDEVATRSIRQWRAAPRLVTLSAASTSGLELKLKRSRDHVRQPLADAINGSYVTAHRSSSGYRDAPARPCKARSRAHEARGIRAPEHVTSASLSSRHLGESRIRDPARASGGSSRHQLHRWRMPASSRRHHLSPAREHVHGPAHGTVGESESQAEARAVARPSTRLRGDAMTCKVPASTGRHDPAVVPVLATSDFDVRTLDQAGMSGTASGILAPQSAHRSDPRDQDPGHASLCGRCFGTATRDVDVTFGSPTHVTEVPGGDLKEAISWSCRSLAPGATVHRPRRQSRRTSGGRTLTVATAHRSVPHDRRPRRGHWRLRGTRRRTLGKESRSRPRRRDLASRREFVGSWGVGSESPLMTCSAALTSPTALRTSSRANVGSCSDAQLAAIRTSTLASFPTFNLLSTPHAVENVSCPAGCDRHYRARVPCRSSRAASQTACVRPSSVRCTAGARRDRTLSTTVDDLAADRREPLATRALRSSDPPRLNEPRDVSWSPLT